MSTLTDFNPAAHGLRVADTPITRKPRRPSSKRTPRPQYANAVWWSFQNGDPLEAVVPTRSVEDTVRKLKAAARYLERTESKPGKPAEVRVQISVEPAPDEDGKPKRSVVKFLGHKPFLLGRRVAKVASDAFAPEAAPAAPEPAQPAKGAHRRTTAGTRSTASHRKPKASLPGAVARAVITQTRPPQLIPEREGVLSYT